MQQGIFAPTRRADIQGLRAVAALAVLFYHIGGWLGSGHIGVDIFFVISGYVISIAYLGRFNHAPQLSTALDFFLRRILRLAPALLVVTAVTLVLTEAILPPTQNKLFAIEAGIAATIQKSNFYFPRIGTNYWLDNLSRNPFLHTWSLGVEWQFYLLFPMPFVAAGLVRRTSPLPLAGAGLAVLALVLAGSLWLFITSSAMAAFYGPWSRFWQFALGIVACLATRRRGAVRNEGVLSTVVVAAIVALALLPPSLLPQSISSALASVLTAGLLCAAPSGLSPAGRVLTSSPMQAVGHASYSIYLTHWPVAVLGRLLLGEGPACDAVLVILSLATGFLLSRTIEYRFMHVAHRGRTALACLAVVALAVVAEKGKGAIPSLPWYGNPPFVAHADSYHNFWWTELDAARNELRHSAQFEAGGLFRRPVPDTHVQEAVAARSSSARWVVGVGNSYIQSDGVMLRRYALEQDVNLALYDVSDCSWDNEALCIRGFDHVAASLTAHKDQIELIYVAFRGIDDPQSLPAKLVPRLIASLEHAGLRVVIQGPSPVYSSDPQSCLSLLRPCPPTQSLPVDLGALAAGERRLQDMFPRRPEFSIWSPYKDLCKDGACLARDNGISIAMDSDHFSNAGQRYLYPYLRAALTSALTPP